MPASTKGEEDKNQLLGKLIAFHSMKYEEQQKRTIEEMDVEIAYYEGDWSFSHIVISERKISPIQLLAWSMILI